MTKENQFIGFTKWTLKWLCLLTLGFVLIVSAGSGIYIGFKYWTHGRHLKNIEVYVTNESVTNVAEFLDGIPNINKEELREIYVKDGVDSYKQVRDDILAGISMSELEQTKVRRAIGLYFIHYNRQRLGRIKNQVLEMRKAETPEQEILEYIKSEDVTEEKLEKANIFFEFVPVEKLTFCSEEHPIYVYYKNNTTKVIEYTEIDFTANLPHHSSNILKWDAELESDYIVEPGKTNNLCMKLSVKKKHQNHYNLDKAVYVGEVTTVRFKKKGE